MGRALGPVVSQPRRFWEGRPISGRSPGGSGGTQRSQHDAVVSTAGDLGAAAPCAGAGQLWGMLGRGGAHRQLEVEGVTRKQVHVAGGAETRGSRSGGRPGQGRGLGWNSVGRPPEAPGCGPGSVLGCGRQGEASFMIPRWGRAGVRVRAWARLGSGLWGVNLPPHHFAVLRPPQVLLLFPGAPFGCCFSDMYTYRENRSSPSSRPGRESGF